MKEPTNEALREDDHEAVNAAGGHASRGTYWLIAVILGIITILEVAVFYVPTLRAVIVPVLLTLSAAKFVLVAMFFMHLKYDSPVLTMVFSVGIFVAMVIVFALMALFGAGGFS